MDQLNDSTWELLFQRWRDSETPRFQQLREDFAQIFGNFFQLRHVLGVMQASYQIAKTLGFSEDECLQTAKAAFFHDLGKESPKIKRFFENTDRVTETKRRRLRWTHCQEGPRQLELYHQKLERLSLLTGPGERSLTEYVQRHHHDGPYGLPNTSFDQVVNIVAVSDIFDVITEPSGERQHRPKKPLTSVAAAAEEIWQFGVRRKRQLDSSTALAFITRVLEVEFNLEHRVFII